MAANKVTTTNIIGNVQAITTKDNIILKADHSIFNESFYFNAWYEDALIKKFIKSTERMVRQSTEYTNYLALIKTNYNILNYDNVLSHISSAEASIEFHHYPFTLYDIVDIMMNHKMMTNQKFTSFSLAKEIMGLHFNQMIGLVPLTTTNHQLAHLGGLFISTKQIFGQWEMFMGAYKHGLTPDHKTKISELKKLSEENAATDMKGLFK